MSMINNGSIAQAIVNGIVVTYFGIEPRRSLTGTPGGCYGHVKLSDNSCTLDSVSLNIISSANGKATGMVNLTAEASDNPELLEEIDARVSALCGCKFVTDNLFDDCAYITFDVNSVDPELFVYLSKFVVI